MISIMIHVVCEIRRCCGDGMLWYFYLAFLALVSYYILPACLPVPRLEFGGKGENPVAL